MKATLTARSALLAALFTSAIGLAMAQTPAPKPSPAPAALSDSLPIPPAPEPRQSNSWVLLDAANGQVLAGENVDERVAPASITKVMTSYVLAAEMKAGKIGRDDQVMMTENAWRTGGPGTDGSKSGLEVNKQGGLEDMEKGMGGKAGTDAAIALARAEERGEGKKG